MATFDYALVPMDNPKTQIRMLRLRPGRDGATVRADLEICEFDDCPPYVAISYTWGDEQPMIPITVNGLVFRVRVNCWYSLWQLQYHHESRAVWIDSICINQGNVPEKNAQVANMGRIYGKAELTACCLGPGHNLAAARKLMHPPAVNDVFKSLAAERDSLRELQHRSYFRRIWIKQEIILSHNLRLYCGVDSLDWETYVDILGTFVAHDVRYLTNTLEQHPKSKDLGINVHQNLVDGRTLYHASSPDCVESTREAEANQKPWAHLWAIMGQYSEAECHDRHDKVFALVSLLPESVRLQLDLVIDYERPLLGLCLEMIEKYIREYSATSGADERSVIPVDFWTSMSTMVRHWVCPELSDTRFSTFAGSWSTPVDTSLGPPDILVSLGHSPDYASLEVWYRYPISNHLDIDTLLAYQYLEDPELITQMSRAYKHYISRAMPVKDVPTFLRPLMHHSHEDEEFYGAKDKISLFGLPAPLQVRIIVSQFETSLDYNFYIVSSNIELSDEIVICRLNDPHEDGFYLPIVRFRGESLTSTPTRYSILVGWALLLGRDGSLQRSAGFERPSMLETLDTLLLSEANASTSSEHCTFHAHYEDFILESLLIQDSSAYLTHPRTHKIHPSFFAEGPARRADTATGSTEMSKKKKRKRRVGFA